MYYRKINLLNYGYKLRGLYHSPRGTIGKDENSRGMKVIHTQERYQRVCKRSRQLASLFFIFSVFFSFIFFFFLFSPLSNVLHLEKEGYDR